MNCGGVEVPVYYQGIHKMMSQFRGVDLEKKILWIEQDLLAQHVGQGWGVATIGLPLRL